MAHIGVLKAFQDHGIRVDLITGSSIGAVIGAMYSATLDPGWVEKKFKKFINSKLYKSIGLDRINSNGNNSSFLQSITKPVKEIISLKLVNDRLGLLKSDRLRAVIEYLLPVKSFRELKIPFQCVSVDLNTGKDVIFSNGDLITAVTASSSIPGYMQPVKIDSSLLSDGAVSMPYPVKLLEKMGAGVTVAVDINIRKFSPLDSPGLLQILSRTEQISTLRLNSMMERDVDILLQPDVGEIFWADFGEIDKLIERGYHVVCNDLKTIQSKLKRSFTFQTFRKIIRKLEHR